VRRLLTTRPWPLRLARHLDGDLAARGARRCVPLDGKVRRSLACPLPNQAGRQAPRGQSGAGAWTA